ncbi:protein SENSITIVE TO PROTON RHIZOTOXICITY 1 [Impatiens glandulifera]|uniref:protein SENSITIVE TO PROTON RHIZOTOXICITY 1 n=1 Tax=Impatiens glandulifera TaxID=253017 RepID=UPI001FB12BAA|nr:protein SENSITIVE TO PROTON RHIZOTOXICITY 1 [Impatiens glandulifera]
MNSKDNNSNLQRMWTSSSSSSRNELHKNVPPDHSVFNPKWEQDHSLQYDFKKIQSQFSIQQDGDPSTDWDPKAMINNLSFLQQKVYQLQDMVHMIVDRRSQTTLDQSQDLVTQQQHLITADITSIIVQLISMAGTLLPSVKQQQQTQQTLGDFLIDSQPDQQIFNIEDQEVKDEEEEDEESENLLPGSYEILQLEKEEILAPHTHFCTICGKGFKRDANLRMHMRGHGDEYKTAAALAKPPPNKETMGNEASLIKRYSCPYSGCKRNKDHKKFQSLKTILCVKNHYKRTHCEKRFMCSRCNTKKFSVIADLKTHEKHCGRDKWLCSCGTTFSRKDKLFGHITLFQGHTPAIPLDESCKASTSSAAVAPSVAAGAGASSSSGVDHSTTSGFFSSMAALDECNGFNEFGRPVFDDDSENTFSFLLCNNNSYHHPPQTNGDGGPYNSNDL